MTAAWKTQRGEIHRGLLAGGVAALIAGVVVLVLVSRTSTEPPRSLSTPSSPSAASTPDPHAGHAASPDHSHGTENLSLGERYPELAEMGTWLAKNFKPGAVIYAGEPVSVQAAGGIFRPLPTSPYEEALDTIVEEKGDFVMLHEWIAGEKTPELAPLTIDKGMAYYEPRLSVVRVKPGPRRNMMLFRVIRPGGPDSLHTEDKAIGWSKFMKHFDNHMVHGELAMRKGRWKSAADEFRFSVADDSSNVIALNNRAWCLMKANRDLDQAVYLARKAVSLAPDEPDFLDTLIEVLKAAGKNEEAETYAARLRALQAEGSE